MKDLSLIQSFKRLLHSRPSARKLERKVWIDLTPLHLNGGCPSLIASDQIWIYQGWCGSCNVPFFSMGPANSPLRLNGTCTPARFQFRLELALAFSLDWLPELTAIRKARLILRNDSLGSSLLLISAAFPEAAVSAVPASGSVLSVFGLVPFPELPEAVLSSAVQVSALLCLNCARNLSFIKRVELPVQLPVHLHLFGLGYPVNRPGLGFPALWFKLGSTNKGGTGQALSLCGYPSFLLVKLGSLYQYQTLF